MNFWTAFAGVLVASVIVFIATSINGKTEHAGGHDDHGHGGGHGHDDHGHGHGHH